MIEVLDFYKTYLPHRNISASVPGSIKNHDKDYVTTVIGGDYLSAARARGAQYIRSTSEFREHRLGGFLPVSEDWHAKQCLMEVSHQNRSTMYASP